MIMNNGKLPKFRRNPKCSGVVDTIKRSAADIQVNSIVVNGEHLWIVGAVMSCTDTIGFIGERYNWPGVVCRVVLPKYQIVRFYEINPSECF